MFFIKRGYAQDQIQLWITRSLSGGSRPGPRDGRRADQCQYQGPGPESLRRIQPYPSINTLAQLLQNNAKTWNLTVTVSQSASNFAFPYLRGFDVVFLNNNTSLGQVITGAGQAAFTQWMQEGEFDRTTVEGQILSNTMVGRGPPDPEQGRLPVLHRIPVFQQFQEHVAGGVLGFFLGAQESKATAVDHGSVFLIQLLLGCPIACRHFIPFRSGNPGSPF